PTLTAGVGTFALSGEIATLSTSNGSFSLPLAVGSFSFVGESVTLIQTGSFTIVAQPVSFDLIGGLGNSDYAIDASVTSFALFGPPVTLTGPSGTVFSLTTSPGLFGVSGFSSTGSQSIQFSLVLLGQTYSTLGFDISGSLQSGQCVGGIPLPGQLLNIEIITDAFQKIGIVDETSVPSAEQGANGLRILNDYLLNQAADGLRLGWFKQTDLSAIAPLRQEDVFGVKLLLARQLATHYGITVQDPILLQNMEEAERMLTKRSLAYFESDLSELSRPQGGPWGGPNWF